jgi:hypothetical protein
MDPSSQPDPPSSGDTTRPALSVFLVTREGYKTVRKTIGFLKRQTALDRLELILVAPSRQVLQLDEEDVAAFRWLQVVEVGQFENSGQAFAAAVQVARAEWVMYGEEHSYPAPNWAEVLIEAQRGPYGVVGCAMTNENPDTLTSWAHLLAQFGPVVVPVESGLAGYVAGHHSSYRREQLLEFGDDLPELLDGEIALHHALVARGHQLYLAAEAVSSHVNVSRFGAFVKLEFLGQRLFGALRARSLGWSWAKRLFYAAASPLIPLVRLVRASRDVRRVGSDSRNLVPWIYPIMAGAMVAGGVGEALGYLFGSGRVAAQKIDLELDRYAYTVESDRLSETEVQPPDSP